MTSSLTSLPEDILFAVMAHLDSASLPSMALTCRSLYDYFQSKQIRYIYELGLHELVDTGSNLPPSELLTRLRDRQKAWEELDWKRVEIVKVPGQVTAYELVAGTFSRMDGTDLLVSWLPSATQPGHTLYRPSVGIESRDFAIDTAQDLIILLEERELPNGSWQMNLHCRSVSTNQIHPHAAVDIMSFEMLQDEDQDEVLDNVLLQLADDILALFAAVGDGYQLLLWNWRKGLLIYSSLDQGLPPLTHSFDMLRRDAFIITSAFAFGQILVYRFLPNHASPPVHVSTLELPPTAPMAVITSLRVHSGQFQAQPTPGVLFAPRPESRVHVFFATYATQSRLPNLCSLFVRSETFLRYVDRPNEEDSGPQIVQWGRWGERESRFMEESRSNNWLRYAHGNRVVRKSGRAIGIEVLDFSNISPYHVVSPARQRFGHDDPTISERKDIFEEDVVTRLPYYIASRVMERNPFAYMIDEERIVGFEFIDTGMQFQVYAF